MKKINYNINMGEAFLSVVEIVFLNEPELSFVIAHRAFPDFLYSFKDFFV